MTHLNVACATIHVIQTIKSFSWKAVNPVSSINPLVHQSFNPSEFSSGDFFEEDGDEFVALVVSNQRLLQSTLFPTGDVVGIKLQIPLLTKHFRRSNVLVWVISSKMTKIKLSDDWLNIHENLEKIICGGTNGMETLCIWIHLNMAW